MSKSKHILLSLCGMTPQILTETLYCMMVQPPPKERVMLDEIWVVTTASGKKAVCEQLLDKPDGKFYRFCREFDIDASAITFDEAHILAPGDLSDILNVHDNESFANMLTRKVWELTRDQNSELHCSIAGGRKTMSAYLAMIMQFFARQNDRLFHILTGSPDFENNKEFFYPPKTPVDIKTRDGRFINTNEAGLVLVDIPFIRLREKFPEFQTKCHTFTEMVKKAQKWISQPHDPPRLVVDVREEMLYIGDRFEIHLPHANFSIYRLFVENSLNRPSEIAPNDYVSYFLRGGMNFPERAKQRLFEFHIGYAAYDAEHLWPRLQQEISKINRAIEKIVGEEPPVGYYLISSTGRYGAKRYGIKIDKKHIELRQ